MFAQQIIARRNLKVTLALVHNGQFAISLLSDLGTKL
jgi:hypothetical protein